MPAPSAKGQGLSDDAAFFFPWCVRVLFCLAPWSPISRRVCVFRWGTAAKRVDETGQCRMTATFDASGAGGGRRKPEDQDQLPLTLRLHAPSCLQGHKGEIRYLLDQTLVEVLVHSSRITSCPEGWLPTIYLSSYLVFVAPSG